MGGKNYFFMNHNFQETQIENLQTKRNVDEAKLIVEFCRYLIKQGYKPE